MTVRKLCIFGLNYTIIEHNSMKTQNRERQERSRQSPSVQPPSQHPGHFERRWFCNPIQVCDVNQQENFNLCMTSSIISFSTCSVVLGQYLLTSSLLWLTVFFNPHTRMHKFSRKNRTIKMVSVISAEVFLLFPTDNLPVLMRASAGWPVGMWLKRPSLTWQV